MVYPRMTIPEPYAREVRTVLRKIPTHRLQEAYQALEIGQATGIEVLEANRTHALSAIREILWERGKDPVGERMVTALLTGTINDITSDQMNRIVRRLTRMPEAERGIPKRVAEVISEELGPQKAIQYIDKALEGGQITVREYDEMRATILLLTPRKEIPPPLVRQMTAEIVETQKRLREDFKKLTGEGQQAFRRPFTALDEDVKRIKKSWGL